MLRTGFWVEFGSNQNDEKSMLGYAKQGMW